METSLGDFLPRILALLAGGLLSSLGLTYAARRPAGRARLARLGGPVFALAGLAIAALCGSLAYLLVRSVLAEGVVDVDRLTAPRLLLFGFLIGVPLSLPGLLFAWGDARAQERTRSQRREWIPTKDDRRKYAADLARQIEEMSPRARRITASVGGEGGRVLTLAGDIDAKEGDRLTAALRADLEELGFKRVEGGEEAKAWWSRV